MQVTRLTDHPEALADPAADAWGAVAEMRVALRGAPVTSQPSRYVRSVWAAAPTGRVRQVGVKVAAAADEILFRLEWADPDEDREHAGYGFPDGAAVMFATAEAASVTSMGSADAPVELWHWRPDLDGECEELTAKGLGTVAAGARTGVTARSAHEGDRWSVVFRRARRGNGGVDLAGDFRVAFAVWEGGAGERAGLKATSGNWIVWENGSEA